MRTLTVRFLYVRTAFDGLQHAPEVSGLALPREESLTTTLFIVMERPFNQNPCNDLVSNLRREWAATVQNASEKEASLRAGHGGWTIP
jgi:hypothetical protein